MSFHKITSAISMLLTVMLICSCDRDLNEGVDYYSPQADIARDTFEVARGENVEIKAFIKDESGIAYLGLEYADWNLKDEISVDEVSRTTGYDYTYKITVPLNALYEWDEVYTKHDGTKFNIKQRYHKISLTCYDGVKNKNIFYFYIKVKKLCR